METRSKKDHDICFLSVIFDFVVWDLFKGEWCHSLPDIKGLANGSPGINLSNLGGVVVDTVGRKKEKGGEFTFAEHIQDLLQLQTWPHLQTLQSQRVSWFYFADTTPCMPSSAHTNQVTNPKHSSNKNLPNSLILSFFLTTFHILVEQLRNLGSKCKSLQILSGGKTNQAKMEPEAPDSLI